MQKQVKSLEKDQREHESVVEVRDRLGGEFDQAFRIGCTAASPLETAKRLADRPQRHRILAYWPNELQMKLSTLVVILAA